MALFTLFSQLINIQLAGTEGIAGLYGRILEIKSRLENWDPPITLPDQLLIVCMLRLLPRTYHPTRTIIMTRDAVTLKASKNMLLDSENRDAERVAAAVGSKVKPSAAATALVTYDPRRKPNKKKKRKKKTPRATAEKSAKYKSEGPCSYHGSRCTHSSSECWELHPELKPEAVIADGEALAATTVPHHASAFGFVKDDWGYALVISSEEVNTASCEEVNTALVVSGEEVPSQSRR